MTDPLLFVEYKNIGQKTYEASGNTFTFDPFPRSITKKVSVKWRIRRPGYMKKLERARFRANEKIELSFNGSCSPDKRNELEWFSKRDSLFKVENFLMKTYHSLRTADSTAYTPSSWAGAKSQGEETVYIVIESVHFTQNEAKPDWYDYKIKARRVHLTRH